METLKKMRKKVSSSRKKPAQKSFSHGRDSNPRPSAWQTSKTILINLYAKWQQKLQVWQTSKTILINLYAKWHQNLQVWQLVDAAYKAYEICHLAGPKKRKKVTAKSAD